MQVDEIAMGAATENGKELDASESEVGIALVVEQVLARV